MVADLGAGAVRVACRPRPGQRGIGRPGSAATSAVVTCGPGGERVPGRQDHDLSLGAELLDVEPGGRVERPVQQAPRRPGRRAAGVPARRARTGARRRRPRRARRRRRRAAWPAARWPRRPWSPGPGSGGPAAGAARRVRRSAASTASRAARPSRSRTAPASVSATARRVRSSSVTPSRRSSCWIARDSGGCAMPSRSAARPKCSSSATATKYRSSRVSMRPAYAGSRLG